MKINYSERGFEAPFFVAILIIKYGISFSIENLNGVKFCSRKFDVSCNILCYNLNLDSKKEVRHLMKILETTGEHGTCILELNQCVCSGDTNDIWKSLNTSKIETLKIINSQIDIYHVDFSDFKNLRKLILKNTTTTALGSKIFENHLKLQKLQIRQNRYLKSMEKGILVHKNLRYLQIQNIHLNEIQTEAFFGNLTKDARVPSLRKLDWSYNNFGNFSKSFLQHFSKLNTLILNNSNITNFEVGSFNYSNIKIIYINGNKLVRLQEQVFRPLLESDSKLFIAGNDLICDCQMKWLQDFVKKKRINDFGDFKSITCSSPTTSKFLESEICGKELTPGEEVNAECFRQARIGNIENFVEKNYIKLAEGSRKFSITKDEPEYVGISLSDSINTGKTIMIYVNFSNSSFPIYGCFKIQQRSFTIEVFPDVNYLFCVVSVDHPDIFDCIPHKTKPLYENQIWLTKKSILLSVIFMIVIILLAMLAGALILYLSVRKNPSLIRGSKRVIEVKRHDKAQILIMPRGYEDSRDNNSRRLTDSYPPLEPSRSSVSFDTLSTVSYVSANQPTQFEILTYRLNRLRELFQINNDLPPPRPSLPMQISSANQRIPPNVDLLFEYEWYTISTTTTTQI